MAKLSEQFQDYLFSKYPRIYREMDKFDLLKNFTYALTDPAIPLIKKVEQMYDLLDATNCPDWAVHIFYGNFGGEFYDGIDLSYQKRFLKNVMDIIRKRGTYECVRYMTAVLTGLDVDLEYSEEDGEKFKNRNLTVTLKAKTLNQIKNLEYSIGVVTEFITEEVPFFISATVLTEVYALALECERYAGSAMSHTTYQDLTFRR